MVVDLVPNHVGVATPSANPWWWDVLRLGQDSRYAEAFDIDWTQHDGRILLPVLGSAADLDRLERDGDTLVIDDRAYPIAPGTGDGDPRAVHDRQHYELADWHRGDGELNYRRFFTVATLAGLRVEVPWVFDESHALVETWIRSGQVDALRIDHPDGLADPGGYLDRLAALTGGVPVWVEKILEPGESLPAGWATRGTTGYDALGEIDRVLTDPAGAVALDALAARLAHHEVDWPDLVHERKRAVADAGLRSEVQRLARESGDGDLAATADAIAELLTCFPVYRSYLPIGTGSLAAATDEVLRRRPDLAAALERVLPRLADPADPLAVRFQQTSGMVMAKGVEDNAFYRYTRLTSLTEVGGDPSAFAMPVEEFHAALARRAAEWPDAMTTLSTHDTKRSEDVRARLAVLAELPGEWVETFEALDELAPIPDGTLANLVWQAAIGAWPISRERLTEYALKAAHEAAASTTYTEPDEQFESALRAAVDAVYDVPPVAAIVERVAASLAPAGWSNSLSAKLLQLAGPGMPDVYEGTELFDLSLVDPDNRRPVDFAARRALLADLDAGALPGIDADGAAKLLVVWRTLRLRREHPDRFTGYTPVFATGPAADHLVAFDRGGAIAVTTRLPVSLAEHGGWRDTTIELAEPMTDVFTGDTFAGRIELADLLARYPVALLTVLET